MILLDITNNIKGEFSNNQNVIVDLYKDMEIVTKWKKEKENKEIEEYN